MLKDQSTKPGLLDVLLSLLVDPRGTAKQLFGYGGRPPWVFTTLTLFMCTCIVAPLLYNPNPGIPTEQAKTLPPVVMATLGTIVLTTFFLFVVLRVLNLPSSMYRAFASLIYSSVPFITTLAALLIVNKIANNDLSLLGSLVAAKAPEGRIIAAVFPTAIKIAAVCSLLVLAQALRSLTNSSGTVGLLLAIVTLPLLLGAFIVALTATELLFPDTSVDTIRLFSGYVSNATR